MKDLQDAVLPLGNDSIFSGISENFSFHSSPESFIARAVLRYHERNPDGVQKRTPVRARILNRDVAILSAYDHVKHVLEDSGEKARSGCPRYVAAAPYDQLMQEFFPSPNLLLNDGQPHRDMKVQWKGAIRNLENGRHATNLRDLIRNNVSKMQLNTPLDLYDSLKTLAWQIFLSAFLGLDENDYRYHEVVQLQETLLRGQFSLFPVSVNAGFLWKSPRKQGIEARKKLQSIIADIFVHQRPAWLPKDICGMRPHDELVNHLLMATSSLAVKGFASLCLAFLLNTYLSEDATLPLEVKASESAEEGSDKRAKAIFLETARLSPPVVGIMRRTTTSTVLSARDEGIPATLLPEGWDVWPYFPGANRDPVAFGEDAECFRPGRYLGSETNKDLAPEPIMFGLGEKKCLGTGFVTTAALAVWHAFRDNGLRLEGRIDSPGVRGWLGRQTASPQEWAADMKQLPTQRPAKPIEVCIVPVNNRSP